MRQPYLELELRFILEWDNFFRGKVGLKNFEIITMLTIQFYEHYYKISGFRCNERRGVNKYAGFLLIEYILYEEY